MGEMIALQALRTVKKFDMKVADRLYIGLIKDLHHMSEIDYIVSDGYDVAQTAICFLYQYAGREAYLTKGSSNLFDDSAYVPIDFVLGKAEKMPGFISRFLGFACSRQGLILLVVVPCGILLFYLAFELVSELTRENEK